MKNKEHFTRTTRYLKYLLIHNCLCVPLDTIFSKDKNYQQISK